MPSSRTAIWVYRLDRFATGQEFGFGQDGRAAPAGIAPVAAALPFGLQPGGSVDALDLGVARAAAGVRLALGPGRSLVDDGVRRVVR
jgi:hypothetical protein